MYDLYTDETLLAVTHPNRKKADKSLQEEKKLKQFETKAGPVCNEKQRQR